VIVSVQSLIFVPEPYFNEPGYEQQMGTEQGTSRSAQYNADVREHATKWAILEMLRRPPTGFEDVVRTHFFLRRPLLLRQLERWLADAAPGAARPNAPHHRTMTKLLADVRVELDKLPDPAAKDKA